MREGASVSTAGRTGAQTVGQTVPGRRTGLRARTVRRMRTARARRAQTGPCGAVHCPMSPRCAESTARSAARTAVFGSQGGNRCALVGERVPARLQQLRRPHQVAVSRPPHPRGVSAGAVAAQFLDLSCRCLSSRGGRRSGSRGSRGPRADGMPETFKSCHIRGDRRWYAVGLFALTTRVVPEDCRGSGQRHRGLSRTRETSRADTPDPYRRTRKHSIYLLFDLW